MRQNILIAALLSALAITVKAQERATVYFTKDISAESLIKIYRALGVEATGRVALKISTGESERSNHLRPAFIKPLVDEIKGCNLSYGRTPYDFDEQTVTSFEPGQTVTVERTGSSIRPKCVGLLFHPDFLNRTNLGKSIRRYEFFSYSSTEALHLSESEMSVFKQVLDMIEAELKHPIDNHTRELIVSNIELLLNYCLRFYDRQFITREEINHSVVKQFDMLLREYIKDKALVQGLPTVNYFADA